MREIRLTIQVDGGTPVHVLVASEDPPEYVDALLTRAAERAVRDAIPFADIREKLNGLQAEKANRWLPIGMEPGVQVPDTSVYHSSPMKRS